MKKIVLAFLSICMSSWAFAQPSLMTPTASGGFENGPPFNFANNFWTAANGAANPWAMGTGSFSWGARGAYIGDATNFVGTNVAAINHLYRNTAIAIPAGATNVQFAFRYRQPVVDPGNDSFIVSVTSTATPNPVAGTTVSPLHLRLYQNTNTAYAGYTLVGPLDLTAFAGTNIRIVFTHVNNGAGPIGIPAIDSLSLIYCPNATVTGANSICVGATTVYTVSTTTGVWSSSNPAVATAGGTAATTTVTGVSAGTATISYSLGTTCFYSKVITVNAVPPAITGTLSACQGTTSTLSNSMGGGAWSSSAPATASVSGGLVSAISPGLANITYTMPSTCRTISQFTVNAAPSVVNVTGGGSFCASGGGVAVGTDGSSIGTNYNLYNGSTLVSTTAGTGGPLNFGLLTTAGTYTVSATIVANSCSNNMSGSASIVVAAPVTPSVTLTAPAAICSGDAAVYTATPIVGGPTPSYQWFVNGIPSGTGTVYGYVPTSGDVVSVTMTAGGICAVPASATASSTAMVTPYSSPGIAIAVGPNNPSCLGALVTFAATPTYGGATPAYRWTKNGVNVATGPSYSYIPANGDVVYCMLSSSYACRTIDTVLSSNITMAVATPLPAPVVNISAMPGTNVPAGTTVTFTAMIVGSGSGPVTYQWIINGMAVAGATTAVFSSSTLVSGDIVTCKVSNTDPCALSSVKSVLMSGGGSTGIAQTSVQNNVFTLMPNPNKGTFTVYGETNGSKEISIRVNNLLGQEVYSSNITTAGSVLNENISISNLASGVYILHINTGTKNQLIHFVVNN